MLLMPTSFDVIGVEFNAVNHYSRDYSRPEKESSNTKRIGPQTLSRSLSDSNKSSHVFSRYYEFFQNQTQGGFII